MINPAHRASYNSIDNRNLIVNVQVMGKKQEIITYQNFKDMNSHHSRAPSNEGYVLAYSGDRPIQTHRDSSSNSMFLNDYITVGNSRHKKTQSQGRKLQ